MKRYRYILNGRALPDRPLSDYRLIAANMISHSVTAIRVTLPDSVELTKYTCDPYSTTESNIKLKDLEPVVICKINNKFISSSILTEQWLSGLIEPHEFTKDKHLVIKFGILSPKQYAWFMKNHRIAWKYDRLPVKEDGTILDIPVPNTLDAHKNDIDSFRKALETAAKDKNITIDMDDIELEYWYHYCNTMYDSTVWISWSKISYPDAFIRRYIEHLDFEQNVLNYKD